MSEFDLSDTETYGDEDSITCPYCGENDCLTDAHIDGCLTEGYRPTCLHCGKMYEIVDVSYTIDVTARQIDVWADFCEFWRTLGWHILSKQSWNRLWETQPRRPLDLKGPS